VNLILLQQDQHLQRQLAQLKTTVLHWPFNVDGISTLHQYFSI
jgi:hypothetical protein